MECLLQFWNYQTTTMLYCWRMSVISGGSRFEWIAERRWIDSKNRGKMMRRLPLSFIASAWDSADFSINSNPTRWAPKTHSQGIFVAVNWQKKAPRRRRVCVVAVTMLPVQVQRKESNDCYCRQDAQVRSGFKKKQRQQQVRARAVLRLLKTSVKTEWRQETQCGTYLWMSQNS